MKEEERKDYVKYRLESSETTFLAGKLLYENKLWKSAVNRLYYACFYAVNALLVKNKLASQTHSGVLTLFSKNFIKTGIIEKKYGKIYSRLFSFRQKGDYNDFFEFSEEIVKEFLRFYK